MNAFIVHPEDVRRIIRQANFIETRHITGFPASAFPRDGVALGL
jgi:hypothetical protein